MTMITKDQAQGFSDAFSTAEFDRISAWLKARALAGYVGGDYNYSAMTRPADAIAARNLLVAAGWTVTVDTVNCIATIS